METNYEGILKRLHANAGFDVEHKATREELAAKFPRPHPSLGEAQAELLVLQAEIRDTEQKLTSLRSKEDVVRKSIERSWVAFRQRFERHVQELFNGNDPDGRE